MSSNEAIATRVMTPLNDTVVLNMVAPSSTSPSGRIILPDGTRINYREARRAYVVDAGPRCSKALVADMEVLVAPLVDGVDIDVPGSRPDGDRVREHYRIVRERSVLAAISALRPKEAIVSDIRRLFKQLDEYEQDDGFALANDIASEYIVL